MRSPAQEASSVAQEGEMAYSQPNRGSDPCFSAPADSRGERRSALRRRWIIALVLGMAVARAQALPILDQSRLLVEV
jgi:hypothetical protein